MAVKPRLTPGDFDAPPTPPLPASTMRFHLTAKRSLPAHPDKVASYFYNSDIYIVPMQRGGKNITARNRVRRKSDLYARGKSICIALRPPKGSKRPLA